MGITIWEIPNYELVSLFLVYIHDCDNKFETVVISINQTYIRMLLLLLEAKINWVFSSHGICHKEL